MKLTRNLSIILICISFFPAAVYSQSFVISQVDNSSLLLDQKINLYVSVTDTGGYPVEKLDRENFTIYESVKGGSEEKREIIDFKKGINRDAGIYFCFLLDNSGSMYDAGNGKPTQNDELRKMSYARNALRTLIKDITNPKDRIGFISFNIRIDADIRPTENKQSVLDAIQQVDKPERKDAYTEIYESLYHAVNELDVIKGRKVIILLSDGENYPKKDNPNFTERHGMKGAIENARKVGLSVYTIGLSRQADRSNLEQIASNTGGAYYSAYDPEELENLYTLIRNRILNEYLITYYATMNPAETKSVMALCAYNAKTLTAVQEYFSDTLFGQPQETLNLLVFLAIAVSAAALVILYFLKFEKKKKEASLEVLTVDGRRRTTQALTISDKKRQITISGSDDADLTLMGEKNAPASDLTIENKNGAFTIVKAGSGITVNNKPVKTKVLRSGDLIKVGNTTVVFDGGFKKKSGKKK
ncbi:MAG: VWA domain-containing protein [Spirochaetales bacterium]|nr:VWA domain-containing protein [Spirochaetales bacterium]